MENKYKSTSNLMQFLIWHLESGKNLCTNNTVPKIQSGMLTMLHLHIARRLDMILSPAIAAILPTILLLTILHQRTIMIEIEKTEKDNKDKEKTGKTEKEGREKAGKPMKDSKDKQPNDKPGTNNNKDNTDRT